MKTVKDFFTGKEEENVAESQIRYYCPMKCEGDKTYNAPGNCPDCNMNLVPVSKNSSRDLQHDHCCC